MRFERVVGSTEADWLARLPAAVGERPWTLEAGGAVITIGAGRLRLAWDVREPMAIALVRMPRLGVSFDFEGIEPAERDAFMARFDLYMHRGGG